MNKIIYRTFAIIIAVAMAISCLKNSGYESKYPAVVTFDNVVSGMDKDELFGEDKIVFGSFAGYDLLFVGQTDEEKTDFTGFSLSYATAKDDGYDGLYSANADTASSYEVFALFHNSPEIKTENHHIVFGYAEYDACTCTPVACMVNNTKYVADRIAEYNSQHEEPIEMKLTATGYAGENETGKAEILLAGPSSETETGDSIVSTWTPLELDELGNVDYIDFSITFSDESQTTIPEYFCMDDFMANVYIKIAAE